MRKRVIGVFNDVELLRRNCEALEAAGFEVCPAHNFAELKRHLEAGNCEVIVLGPSIPAVEKLRITNFVRQYAADMGVVELYQSAPQLQIDCAHVATRPGE